LRRPGEQMPVSLAGAFLEQSHLAEPEATQLVRRRDRIGPVVREKNE
jgi:hypothetical protein